MTKPKTKVEDDKSNDIELTKEDLTTLDDLDLVEIPGVGPDNARKLKAAGIYTVMDLASCSAEELADKLGKKDSKRDEVVPLIESARTVLVKSKLLDRDLCTLTEALEKEKVAVKLTTGSEKLDALLLGGIETSAMTEFAGQFGSGKTQCCLTLAVNATQPLEVGGLDSNVFWIDTEGTLKAERVKEIAMSRGIDPKPVLDKIIKIDIYTSSHLELIIKDIGKYIIKYKPKLIVLDSLISLHRAAFTGRGTLADRQQRLNAIMHKLLRVAKVRNLAVVVTNQVGSSPDTMYGNPEKPAGGNIVGHNSTYRLIIRKTSKGRNATMFDSPRHPYGAAEFMLSPKGIEDISPEDKVKKRIEELESKAKEENEETNTDL